MNAMYEALPKVAQTREPSQLMGVLADWNEKLVGEDPTTLVPYIELWQSQDHQPKEGHGEIVCDNCGEPRSLKEGVKGAIDYPCPKCGSTWFRSA
jgi:hypothetical protein